MLALLLWINLFAQTGETAFLFKQVDGLSQSTGYSILKDRQGFLWIATANGLNRYDGIEMKVYKPSIEAKAGEMKGRIIRSDLLEDTLERIWFSTDRTVHCFNKKNETFVTYDLSGKATPGGGVFANPLLIQHTYVWFASAGGGIYQLNSVTGKSVNYPPVLKDERGSFIQLMYNGAYDGKDRLWFASNKGLISFNIVSMQWRRYFDEKILYSISYSRDTLYANEGKEIMEIDIRSLQFNMARFKEPDRKLERDPIHRIYTDKKANTWVGDEKGNVYCKQSGSAWFDWVGNINLGRPIRTNYPVYSFYADTAGVLWTGAYMLGLLKTEMKRQDFSVFPRPDPTKINENVFVNAIFENNPGEVWLGTFQKGVLVLDKKNGEVSSLDLPYKGPQLLYGNSVHMIQKDSKGNLWTGMSGFLFVKEKGTAFFTAIKIPSPSNALQNPQVWAFSEYKDGWILGTNIGLYMLRRVKADYVLKYIPWPGQNRITAIWNNSNEVWIAFESGGISIMSDPEIGQDSRKLFPGTNTRAFLPDTSHQLLWICTSDGLIAWHLPTGRHKVFAEREGLLNSYAYGALADADNLWISTNSGLFRADISFKEDSVLPYATFTNFTAKDGLPDNQFNGLAFNRGQSGEFYFGTTKGLVWFDPATIKPGIQQVRLRLIDMLVNEHKVDSTTAPEYLSSISLPYYQNNLFFRFRGIEYTNPTQVSYAYKMEGWDKDWIYSNHINEVRYNNLAPGSYRFYVKAANGAGVWGKEVYSVPVTISPPFWKTWWFYALSVFVVLTMVILTTRSIVQRKLKRKVELLERQRQLDKERQRISREMHDDIGAGLTQITLITESAKKKARIGEQRELDDIAGTSRKLVNNMGEIIWSLNPENKTLNHLMAYLREQLHKLLEYAGMEYSIRLPENNNEVLLTNEQRRNILLVTREIVNNAVKHSNAKSITILATLKKNILSFEIRDDGDGFVLPGRTGGNGLRNITQRVEELKGELAIDSQPGKGSCFIYSIPLSSTT